MALRTNVAFRRLFAGRLVTNAGDSLYLIATMWLVYDLTGSTTYTSIAGFLLLAPTALQFLFGPLVDRRSPRALLVGTQLVQAVVVLAVPVAWITGHLSVWILLAVVPLLSLLNQIVYPALNTSLPRVVDREDLMSANSAFAIAYQGVDMVFNAVGGIVIALVGGVALFALDAVTFLVAAALFAAVRIPPANEDPAPTSVEPSSDDAPTSGGDPASERASNDPVVAADGGDGSEPNGTGTDGSDTDGTDTDETTAGEDEGPSTPADKPVPDDPANGSYVDELRDGIAYFRGTVLLRMALTVFVGIACFWGTMTVLPAFADARGGPAVYGVAMAGIAGGMLAGFVLAPRLQHRRFGLVMLALHPVGAAAWFAAIAVEWVPATVVLFGVAVVLIGVHGVSVRTIVQGVVPEPMIGRVTALNASIAGVAAPTGALLGGGVADQLGVTAGAALAGVGIAGVGVLFLLDPQLRSLPAVAEMEAADLGLDPGY